MDLLTARPEHLVRAKFSFQDLPIEGGRIEWWGKVDPRAQYVMGADFALGIPGRDYDTICVIEVKNQPPHIQVCEAQGHWGPNFDRVLFAIHRIYNNAFIVGEANNTGTLVLSKLYHEYGATFMFGDRDESEKGRPVLKRLGCWKGTGSVVLPKLRRAVRDREIIIRSRPTLHQMRKIQYKPRSSVEPEAATDDDLRVKVAGGGSPDLVMAAGYGFHGVEEVPYFRPPVPVAPKGSLGDILGYNETFEPEHGNVAKFIPTSKRR